MFKFHGHRFQGSRIEWERLKDWSDEPREGVSISFVFHGAPPTASEARRRVAADIRQDKDTDWLSLKGARWIVDLGILRQQFQLPYEWLDSRVEVVPEYNVLPEVFNESKQQGRLEIVIEREHLAPQDTVWGEYPEDALDPLMPILNRKRMNRDAVGLFDKSSREKSAGVLFVDIDYFKRVNDTYGHASGDNVLVGVGEALRRVIGRRGAAYRYGGEELVVLLPDVDLAEARATAERIRVAIAALEFSDMPSVTASIGVTVAVGGTPFVDVIKLADKAVYKAKNAGRNRVEVSES